MDNEWQKTDKFTPHPKLIKLMEKTKELIELENELMKKFRTSIEEHQQKVKNG